MKAYLLAIETSCDETSAAVVRLPEGFLTSASDKKPEILSNIIYSQIPIHQRYGGVVPEIASRNHVDALTPVVSEAVKEAGIALADIAAVGVTYGAGLLGSLLTGVSYAKGLSLALGVPLVGVNHIHAHIAANFLQVNPPFLCLVVSGGHTMLVSVESHYQMHTLKQTLDDAVGEAFDKVARVLDLPYPGGPQIDKLSAAGNPCIRFFKHSKGIDGEEGFSYSGLKTAVINYLHTAKQRGEKVCAADVCASFQRDALQPLIDLAIEKSKQLGNLPIATAGGVSANSYLRQALKTQAEANGITAIFPPLPLCTDNAAMVAVRASYDLAIGKNIASKSLNATSQIP